MVSRGLQQVVPQEESPEGVLHPSAHLHHVLEDVTARAFLCLDVHHAHRHQEVAAGRRGGGGGGGGRERGRRRGWREGEGERERTAVEILI